MDGYLHRDKPLTKMAREKKKYEVQCYSRFPFATDDCTLLHEAHSAIRRYTFIIHDDVTRSTPTFVHSTLRLHPLIGDHPFYELQYTLKPIYVECRIGEKRKRPVYSKM